MSEIIHIESITEVHKILGIEKPKHPLVTILNHKDIQLNRDMSGVRVSLNLYQISLKKCPSNSFQYGRNSYDFQEGTMIFTSPGQVVSFGEWDQGYVANGWTLAFHPDLIRKSELGRNIDKYSFFSYDANEALHLSDLEKDMIRGLLDKIIMEYSQNIDKHSQKLIISNIELVLDYCTRYYDRQFYTRTNLNNDVVAGFERLLKDYYSTNVALEEGIPTVAYCGTQLGMSPNYLSDLLKKETGRNAQDHIHLYVIDRAKTQLLNSGESISQIAYGLGFDYPQHFSKLFKKKTGMTPAEYRNVN